MDLTAGNSRLDRRTGSKRRDGRHRMAVAAAILLLFGTLVSVLFYTGKHAYAAGDLDRIRDYEVTAQVNPDATVTMVFHIDWEVLDSDSEGPLSWVTIGIPNKHVESIKALSDNIREIEYDSGSGSNVKITFDKKYYEGEVVSFDYSLVQDYLYEMNRLTEGETVYEYIPGWFDNILVDQLVIRWLDAEVESFSPACDRDGGYLIWRTSLDKGERYPVQITYRNDAFSFDESKTVRNTGYDEDDDDAGYAILGLLVILAPILVPVLVATSSARRYGGTANFGGTEKKITRTKIVYYPNCPGCGAARPEGKDNCEYCGRSFIKSEEKIEEKDIPKEETDVRSKQTNGTYRYASSPDTYVRVHVVNIPVTSAARHHTTGHSSGGRSAGGHSSCAHSSCACACAGGGRAGCTTKDFYRTDLKLHYFNRGRKTE